MDENAQSMTKTQSNEQPKKRGRKPSGKKKGYFYEEQEQAFRDYIESTDENVRNRIFSEKLFPAFTKMIESIIRRYDLFTPSEDFSDTFYDTMSFLMTKVNNFDVTKGYKVYSYCGTICKNYLIFKRTQYMKKRDKMISYDDVFSDNKQDREDKDDSFIQDLNNTIILQMIDKIRDKMDNNDTTHELNDNEVKIGYALLEMLTNWDDIFKRLGSDKFNKTSVLFFIKEYTLLTTKEVRDGSRIYKKMYYEIKQKLIDE